MNEVIDDALEIVDRMKDEYYKSKSIATIIYNQSKIGSFSDSIKTNKKIVVDCGSLFGNNYI